VKKIRCDHYHAALFQCLGSVVALPLLPTEEPETILYNGNIWTVDDSQPRAQAVAIKSGRLLAVGSNDEVLHLATVRTRKIDLGFKIVLPGFNDAHGHPVESGVEHLHKVACDKDSIEQIQAALHERAQQTAPGQWVLGFLYDDGKTPRPLNRHDLDSAVPDHPVTVQHRGGHTAFVNSKALELAKVTPQTPDPGELALMVYCLISARSLDHFMAAGIHTGFGDEWLRIGGVKQYADGSISERTAWLSQPYIDIPHNYVGLQLSSREELYETGRKARAAGWQLATHANGDLAIDRILGVYEQIHKELPSRDPRFRIEHCTLLNDGLIQRMQALQVIPVPFSCYVYFHGDVMHFYGEERTRHMFPMRRFLEADLRPTDSSDYTASPSEPMMWLQSQLTRSDMKGNVWGANQRITLPEGIRCGSVNGAYASFEENLKGQIRPGSLLIW
jgi:predicted amidohydrolase YtcJ